MCNHGDAVAVGLDVGGTSTRALVVDVSGHRVGSATAGGGNPISHRTEAWTAVLSEALQQALGEAGPVEVRAIVVGMAGASALAGTAEYAVLTQTMRTAAGADCSVRLAGDTDVAFAAATPEPDGTVLVAGTGAIAAAIRTGRTVRTADGHGWLLGDAGSGFWLGRQAVRAVLAEIDGNGASTALCPLVAEALLGRTTAGHVPRPTREELIRAAYASPPARLARLAPLLTRCADDGDEVASRIARRAVEHLVSTAEAVRAPVETTPFAVTGAVALGRHFVSQLLDQELERRWPGHVVRVTDAAAGATWLALESLPGSGAVPRARLHHRVCAGADELRDAPAATSSRGGS